MASQNNPGWCKCHFLIAGFKNNTNSKDCLQVSVLPWAQIGLIYHKAKKMHLVYSAEVKSSWEREMCQKVPDYVPKWEKLFWLQVTFHTEITHLLVMLSSNLLVPFKGHCCGCAPGCILMYASDVLLPHKIHSIKKRGPPSLSLVGNTFPLHYRHITFKDTWVEEGGKEGHFITKPM